MENKDKKEEFSKKESCNLFKGKFNKKIVIKGSNWSQDPSGEELEIIREE